MLDNKANFQPQQNTSCSFGHIIKNTFDCVVPSQPVQDSLTLSWFQVHCGGGERLDPALLDRTSRPQQREHCGLQQQEVLAPRLTHETHETRRQSVSVVTLSTV